MANAYAREGFLRLRDYYDRFGFRGGNGLVLEAILARAPTDVPAFIAKLTAVNRWTRLDPALVGERKLAQVQRAAEAMVVDAVTGTAGDASRTARR